MAGLSTSATADVSMLDAMLVAKRKAAEAGAARDAGVVAKTGAETARDAAIAARDQAGVARDAGVVAKTGAETARDAAIAARDAGVVAKTGAEAALAGTITARNIAEGHASAADASAISAAESVTAAATAAETVVNQRVIVKEGANDVVWAVQDANGNVGLFLRRSQVLGARALEIVFPDLESDVYPILSDAAGRVALGIRKSGLASARLDADSIAYVLRDYLARLAGVDGWYQTSEHRDIPIAIHDAQKRVAFGVRGSGLSIIRPDADSIEFIGARLTDAGLTGGGTLDPGLVPASVGIDGVTAVSRRGAGLFFLGVDDGVFGGFLTRADIAAPYAISDTAGPIKMILQEGDSTSVGGHAGEVPLWSGAQTRPRRALMFDIGVRPHIGLYALDPSELVDFAPIGEAIDGGYGDTGLQQLVEHLCDLQAARGARDSTWHVVTVGAAGMKIGELFAGTQPYINGSICIDALVRIAAEYGRAAVVPYVSIIAGINDKTQNPASTLLGRFRSWVIARSGDILARTGQATAPKFILEQACSPADNDGPGTYNVLDPGLAVYSLVKERSDVVTTGQCYWLKDDFAFLDIAHKTAKGYSLWSEVTAEVIDVLEAGGTWRGFRPQLVNRSGAVVTITFYAANLVSPLVLDTAWLPNGGDYGFDAGDDDGVLSIASVSVSGLTATVTLSTAPDPAKHPWIGYCAAAGAGATQRAGTWGNLRDSAALGSDVIGTRHHWCCSFKEII